MKLIKFRRSFRETKLNILTDSLNAAELCWLKALECRIELEQYLKINPRFKWSLDPVEVEYWAPEIVKRMASVGFLAKVGPMASVAGVIADMALEYGLTATPTVLAVENGGEIAASTLITPINIGAYTGIEEFKGLGFRVYPEDTPIGIASSSSKLGAGLSFGEADLVTVFAENSGLADAVATAVCNLVKGFGSENTVEKALDKALKVKGVKGCVIIYGDFIGLKGWIPEIKPPFKL
ncbi:UPF0280 family protein [Candidatus Bathyarchaeota archaeon]|nr:UPF0280 family protein [Candidatus Bathyarchaeota archaeon]MBS7614032.1 UPF0280 family protein [Candidatus Bathyarchaeota archaeon]MBS7618922.1 UPF0280 family protein [Candidatus Bathyarchaeota archaeon]